MEHPDTRQLRILPAIVAYSYERRKPIGEPLFIDMVRDILAYARIRKVDPQQVCRKAEELTAINNHS